MNINIPWSTGGGNISISYNGSGNENVDVISDVNLSQQSRSKIIKFVVNNDKFQNVTVNQTACPFSIDQNYILFKQIFGKYVVTNNYYNSDTPLCLLRIIQQNPGDHLGVFCVKAIRNGSIFLRCRDILSRASYILEYDSNFMRTQSISITSSNYSEQQITIQADHYYICCINYGILYCKESTVNAVEYPIDQIYDNTKLLPAISDISKISGRYINSSGNTSSSANGWEVSDIIEIPENYTLVWGASNNVPYYCFYDSNYEYISASNQKGIISIPNNAKYIQYCKDTNNSYYSGLFIINYTVPTYTWSEMQEIYATTVSTSGKYINNLGSATVGNNWSPSYSNNSDYISFKYRVYPGSYFRLVGKTGSGTKYVIMTDLSGKVVQKMNWSSNRYIKGVNVTTDGYVYGSFNRDASTIYDPIIIQYIQ